MRLGFVEFGKHSKIMLGQIGIFDFKSKWNLDRNFMLEFGKCGLECKIDRLTR